VVVAQVKQMLQQMVVVAALEVTEQAQVFL
jgi:hypothetical protein